MTSRPTSKLDEFTGRRLVSEGWRDEAIESYERFRHAASFLYPYLKKPVTTPHGQAILHQAIGREAMVQHEGSEVMEIVPIADVRPLGVSQPESVEERA